MISKMHKPPVIVDEINAGGDGSKIAVVFNGSPLFNGDASSPTSKARESNIRRWIIENDLLDTIVALPDQMFYNTGIYTYVWIVSNRKPETPPWQSATDRRHSPLQKDGQKSW